MIEYTLKDKGSSLHTMEISLKRSGRNIIVIGTAKDESVWHILELRPNGTVYRCSGFPKERDMGLVIDVYGKIREEE